MTKSAASVKYCCLDPEEREWLNGDGEVQMKEMENLDKMMCWRKCAGGDVQVEMCR